jgi:hypothetical protein
MNIRLTVDIQEMKHRAAYHLVRREAEHLMFAYDHLLSRRRARDNGWRPCSLNGEDHETLIAESEEHVAQAFTNFLNAVAFYSHGHVRYCAQDALKSVHLTGHRVAEVRALAEQLVAELPSLIEAHNAAATGPASAPQTEDEGEGVEEDDEACSAALARYSKGCPAAAMEDVCADPAACASAGRCRNLPQHDPVPA